MGKKEPEPTFELVPLPPDMYDKPPEWSRSPETMKCAFRGCEVIVAQEWVLCSEHFRKVINKGQYKVSLNPKMRKAWAEAASMRWERKEWGNATAVS